LPASVLGAFSFLGALAGLSALPFCVGVFTTFSASPAGDDMVIVCFRPSYSLNVNNLFALVESSFRSKVVSRRVRMCYRRINGLPAEAQDVG
jgi:hypothetical protein